MVAATEVEIPLPSVLLPYVLRVWPLRARVRRQGVALPSISVMGHANTYSESGCGAVAQDVIVELFVLFVFVGFKQGALTFTPVAVTSE